MPAHHAAAWEDAHTSWRTKFTAHEREALVAREAIVPAQVTLTNARATQIQQIAKRDSGATASDPALVAAADASARSEEEKAVA